MVTEIHQTIMWVVSIIIIAGIISWFFYRFLLNIYEISALKDKVIETQELKIAELEDIKKTLSENEEILLNQNVDFNERFERLRELIELMEIEKEEIAMKIHGNISELIIPMVQKLKINGSKNDEKLLDTLLENLKSITSSFGTKLGDKMYALTPREVEICNFITNGFTSKEIAMILNVADGTIDRHRNNIRKKMGLNKKGINLTTYLKSL